MKKDSLNKRAWEERETLRDKGQFWTPQWIAKVMVAYAVQDTSLVFDPATGNGAFFEALKSLELPS
jgi:adenine-specific DNA-methyltransferase